MLRERFRLWGLANHSHLTAVLVLLGRVAAQQLLSVHTGILPGPPIDFVPAKEAVPVTIHGTTICFGYGPGCS